MMNEAIGELMSLRFWLRYLHQPNIKLTNSLFHQLTYRLRQMNLV